MLAVLQTWDGKPSLEVSKDIHMAATNVRKWCTDITNMVLPVLLILDAATERVTYHESRSKQ
ncbi:hypothetical protein [Acetivibrio straminisolvens]|uniref:hypothetical protein n=1 Tax=Acetivibrio straminisolvens TaxID=253314 RepID=UPI00103A71F1|nr:hypothetical protein [Acetivibrio straminisolvens]